MSHNKEVNEMDDQHRFNFPIFILCMVLCTYSAAMEWESRGNSSPLSYFLWGAFLISFLVIVCEIAGEIVEVVRGLWGDRYDNVA